MRTGIFVCGRDINLPLPEWERLMWGEPPDKMGSLPMAVKLAPSVADMYFTNITPPIVLGNGCIPGKNIPGEIGFTKKYFLKHLERMTEFEGLRGAGHWIARYLLTGEDYVPGNHIIEIGRIVNNTAEEIVEAAKIFADNHVTKIFMVSCASHIARAMMAQIAAREAGQIPKSQQWFFVADDMFYSDTTAEDVVVVEPPHRTDDRMYRAPLQTHVLLRRFFKLSWEKRAELLPKFDSLLKTFGV